MGVEWIKLLLRYAGKYSLIRLADKLFLNNAHFIIVSLSAQQRFVDIS